MTNILDDLTSLIQYVGIYSHKSDDSIKVYLPPGDKLFASITIEADHRIIILFTEDESSFVTWLDIDSKTYNEQKIHIVKELSNKLSKWYPNLKEPIVPDGKFNVVVSISGDVKPALKIAQYTYPDLEYNKAIEKYIEETLQGKLDIDLNKKYVVKVLGSSYK